MSETEKPYPNTEDHVAKGDWNPVWDHLRDLDPEFLEAYLAFRSVPHREGPLPQKYKELIMIAINARHHPPLRAGCAAAHAKRAEGRGHERRDIGNHPAHDGYGDTRLQFGGPHSSGRNGQT